MLNMKMAEVKNHYPGEFLFRSLVDRVIEIIETWRVVSKLHVRVSQ